MQARRTDGRRASMSVERLEDRVLLSVRARIRDGDLIVTGNAEDDCIEISQDGNLMVITGCNGTLVNGEEDGEFARRVRDDVDISLGSGDDELIADGGLLDIIEVPDDIKIRMGRGDDVVFISGVIVGDDADIGLGKDEDTITIAFVEVDDDVRIAGGLGENDVIVILDGVEVGDDEEIPGFEDFI